MTDELRRCNFNHKGKHSSTWYSEICRVPTSRPVKYVCRAFGTATKMLGTAPVFGPGPHYSEELGDLNLEDLFAQDFILNWESLGGGTIKAPSPVPAATETKKAVLPRRIGISLGTRCLFLQPCAVLCPMTPACFVPPTLSLPLPCAARHVPAPIPSEVGAPPPLVVSRIPSEETEASMKHRRERNKEHAKRSRVRKKFILESLQDQAKKLHRYFP